MAKSGLSKQTGYRLILITLICLLAFSGNSQAQNRTRVEILRCDLLDVNERDRKSTRLNSSHSQQSLPSDCWEM